MRAYVLERTGGPQVLRLTRIPDPTPRPGQVGVRVEAIGINYAEVLSRKGLYGWAPRRPYVPGMEAAGTIERVGADTARQVGESVVVGTQFGAYAERLVVPESRALPAVPHLSLEENAAFPVNYMTAWVSLVEMARLRPTDRVAVTAAAGGVGTAAVQIARAWGCPVIALAGSDEKLERVRALGAEETVNYRRPDFPDRLRAVAGDRGIDVVLEVVGGDVYRACLRCLAPFGRVVVAGYAGLDYRRWNPLTWWAAWRGAPRAVITRMAEASSGVLATHIGYLLADPARLAKIWTELTAFVREHSIRPVVGRVLPFEDIAEAHRFMESRASVGKIVLRV